MRVALTMIIATAIYLVGVVIGLGVMRDAWPARIITALAWPLGPAAFVLVVSVLLLASLLLWPAVMVPFAAVVAALAWWMT